MKEKILFVCQRYGPEINGGAEAECQAYAERLRPFYDVEVLTTCAVDFVTWANEYPEGDFAINGVLVHRFLSEKHRDKVMFDKMAQKLKKKNHSDKTEQKWINAQGPVCEKAVRFLKQHGAEYKVVIFMTYLYYLTVYGLLPEMKNAILVPTAHDEPAIYYHCYDAVFSNAAGFIYNTAEEKKFVEERFPQSRGRPSCTVGYGIEPFDGSLPDVRRKFHLYGRFILYAGRIDTAKGCQTLFTYFRKFKEKYPSDLKLVLVGKAAILIPPCTDIQAFGFVSNAEKYALMKESEMLVLASPFESLSIVVLENMMMKKPVLVNGECAVLKSHCIKSNAGLYFVGVDEFCGALEYLLQHSDISAQMGKNGQKYVMENYQWDSIIGKIQHLIQEI